MDALSLDFVGACYVVDAGSDCLAALFWRLRNLAAAVA
jgi:hypothetical protein